MYLGDKDKNGNNEDRKIIIPLIDEIFKLLIDEKNKVKILTKSKSIAQAFMTF